MNSPSPISGARAPAGLRDFISALDHSDLLLRRAEVTDWRFELGELSRRSKSPLLFERVKDYPAHQVFTGGLCRVESFALALGLAKTTSRPDLLRALSRRLVHPLPPVEIPSPPFPMSSVTGSAVNLFKLPVPWWSEIDAGRYAGTWHVNITHDPETGIRNSGIYRMQVLGENLATVSVSPRAHLARHMEKAERTRSPLEMAVAIGVAEPVVIAAAAALPLDTDELSVAGGFLERPVEMTRCKTVNLLAPADSEIVLEGAIMPGARKNDGPYLDYAGVPSRNPQAYVFRVTGVSSRERPIFRGTAVGRPGAEDHHLFAALAELGLVDFHGSKIRQRVQNALLRRQCFRLFQWAGRIGYWKRKMT